MIRLGFQNIFNVAWPGPWSQRTSLVDFKDGHVGIAFLPVGMQTLHNEDMIVWLLWCLRYCFIVPPECWYGVNTLFILLLVFSLWCHCEPEWSRASYKRLVVSIKTGCMLSHRLFKLSPVAVQFKLVRFADECDIVKYINNVLSFQLQKASRWASWCLPQYPLFHRTVWKHCFLLSFQYLPVNANFKLRVNGKISHFKTIFVCPIVLGNTCRCCG